MHRSAPGSSYFVTTKCHQNRHIFQIPAFGQILVQTLFHYRGQNAHLLHEFVVMPDRLHLILTPSETTSLEKAAGPSKGGSSHRIHKGREHKMEICRQGFFDWTIRDANDWRTKVEYIRTNPVRARLAARATEWPYTSARSELRLDATPTKYLTSGAEAPVASTHAPGLKPRPPEEQKQKGNFANITFTPSARSKDLIR